MNKPPVVPPIKCQGIKTKLVSEIKRIVNDLKEERWVEPFCGSCVVALNVRPLRALLCDTNIHIVRFYKDIQAGLLTATTVKRFLIDEGNKLREIGEDYYYEVRERFNNAPSSLDFLFLNRASFNGVMRFNRHGKYNVPFCRKPDRFAQSYVTKIANQVRSLSDILAIYDWEFRAADFRQTLENVTRNDFVYADPPYMGRHVDYFNSWNESDERDLANALTSLPGRFMLSTWHSNEFRSNPLIEANWSATRFHIFTSEHYYHVGATEELRHPMIEALITNYSVEYPITSDDAPVAQPLFAERPNKSHQFLLKQSTF